MSDDRPHGVWIDTSSFQLGDFGIGKMPSHWLEGDDGVWSGTEGEATAIAAEWQYNTGLPCTPAPIIPEEVPTTPVLSLLNRKG